MLQRELFAICTLYAVSPLHAGSGASTSAVDLPIQRERHTHWPHVQATGVKGAFRAHFRSLAPDIADSAHSRNELLNLIFGSDEQDGWSRDQESIPGAVSFSDAKLVFFPVRSNVAPFVWVTCPAVLDRIQTDFSFAGIDLQWEIPRPSEARAFKMRNNSGEKQIILEDAVVTVEGTAALPELGRYFPRLDMDRLLLVSDDIYQYVVSNCTEIQAQIKIDAEKGTTTDGSLRYQELLPADSTLYTVLYFSSQNFDNALKADLIRGYIQDCVKGFMQIGGDESLGRGICRLEYFNQPENA